MIETVKTTELTNGLSKFTKSKTTAKVKQHRENVSIK